VGSGPWRLWPEPADAVPHSVPGVPGSLGSTCTHPIAFQRSLTALGFGLSCAGRQARRCVGMRRQRATGGDPGTQKQNNTHSARTVRLNGFKPSTCACVAIQCAPAVAWSDSQLIWTCNQVQRCTHKRGVRQDSHQCRGKQCARVCADAYAFTTLHASRTHCRIDTLSCLRVPGRPS